MLVSDPGTDPVNHSAPVSVDWGSDWGDDLTCSEAIDYVEWMATDDLKENVVGEYLWVYISLHVLCRCPILIYLAPFT